MWAKFSYYHEGAFILRYRISASPVARSASLPVMVEGILAVRSLTISLRPSSLKKESLGHFAQAEKIQRIAGSLLPPDPSDAVGPLRKSKS